VRQKNGGRPSEIRNRHDDLGQLLTQAETMASTHGLAEIAAYGTSKASAWPKTGHTDAKTLLRH
jgi:hypothetical protein